MKQERESHEQTQANEMYLQRLLIDTSVQSTREEKEANADRFCKDFCFNRGVEARERGSIRQYVPERTSEDREE